MSPTVEVVRTYLELRSPEQLRAARTTDPRVSVRSPRRHRRRATIAGSIDAVGDRWHWKDRNAWTDERLAAHLASPDDRGLGMPRRRRDAPASSSSSAATTARVEIAYFGSIEAFIGRGIGKAMLTRAARGSVGARRHARVAAHLHARLAARAAELQARGFEERQARDVRRTSVARSQRLTQRAAAQRRRRASRPCDRRRVPSTHRRGACCLGGSRFTSLAPVVVRALEIARSPCSVNGRSSSSCNSSSVSPRAAPRAPRVTTKRSGRSSVGSSSSVERARDLLRQPQPRDADTARPARPRRRSESRRRAAHRRPSTAATRTARAPRAARSRRRRRRARAWRKSSIEFTSRELRLVQRREIRHVRASASCRPSADTSRESPRSRPGSAARRGCRASPRASASASTRRARSRELRREFVDRLALALELEAVVRRRAAAARAARACCPRCTPAPPSVDVANGRSDVVRNLRALDRRARIAELVGEVAQRPGDRPPAAAHARLRDARFVARRRLLVDHEVERHDTARAGR